MKYLYQKLLVNNLNISENESLNKINDIKKYPKFIFIV